MEVGTVGDLNGKELAGEDPDAEGTDAAPVIMDEELETVDLIKDELEELLTDCSGVEEREYEAEETATEETGVDWGIEIEIVVGAVTGVV